MHCLVSGAGQDQGHVRELLQPQTPYYVHISVDNNLGNARYHINCYLSQELSINAEAMIDFPPVPNVHLNGRQLRELAGMRSDDKTGLWKVREDFDVRRMVATLAEGTTVRIIRIFVDGEPPILQHDNYVYVSQGPDNDCLILDRPA